MSNLLRVTSLRAEQQLILLSAGTEARRRETRQRAEALLAEVDLSRLATTLNQRRLLAPLGPRILELEGARQSDTFAAAVGQALEAGRRQSAFLELVCLRLLDRLRAAGIRCAPLKGPLLGESIYGDPGRRLSGDIDLLVATEQLQRAVAIVRELGYEAPTDHLDGRGLPELHLLLMHEHRTLPPVELHWRVHWYEREFAHERLLPPAGESASNWRPAPAAELVALLLFYARDGFIDLRLATDLSAWWDTFGAELSPSSVEDLLRDYPALTRVVRVAAEVAEQVVGLPSERLFAQRPERNLRDRIALRLANPNPDASESQLYADMGLIDGLLTPPGGLGAFVRRQILPPREVLDQQALHGAKRRARSPLSRCAGVLARYALTMTRLMRAPETLR